MKSLHLIASLGQGGAERQLSILAPALARSGVEVHVAYCTGGPNLARMENSSVHLHALASTGNHDPALAWKVFQIVRRLRPDVVQTWLLQMDILGGAAALFNRIPLVVSERSAGELYATNWKTRLRLAVGGHAACIVANSGGGIEYWRPHVRASRLMLVRNCVEVAAATASATTESPAAYAHRPGSPLVLFAGRFNAEKNISVLVDAFIILARSMPKVVIAMLGDGPERETTMRKIEVAGLAGRILVPGYSAELSAWIQRAAVCVSVSRFEGHPNVVLEAAAGGCPLVLSDIPAHREIFDENSVNLVAADSPASVADSITDTLLRPEDARRRAARAQLIVAKWDTPSLVAAYKSIYLHLAEKRSADST